MSDLLTILTQEHRQVQELLNEMTQAKGVAASRREELLDEFERAIGGHMIGEERVFYPMLHRMGDSKAKALESEEEHAVAKILLGQLRGTSPDDERWVAKAKVLKEMINHHIREEEGELFETAKKVLDKNEMDRMLKEYESERDKVRVK